VQIQVRGVRIRESYRTAQEANERALQLRLLRRSGLAAIRGAPPREQTLGQTGEALLLRKRTIVSRKTKRKLREGGLEWWQRVTRPWTAGAYAGLPLSLLHRADVEDAIALRAREHPKAANDELYALKAILRYAGARGARYDQSILEIEPIARMRRVRRALGVAELELLASHAPAYAERLLLFLGTTGVRINEAFTLADDRVDLQAGEIFIPRRSARRAPTKSSTLRARRKRCCASN